MKKMASKLMYSCEQVAGFVYDYVDQKLGLMTRARFELHLKACKKCHEYVNLYSTAANPSEFIKENPIPKELKERTLSFLEKEGILTEDKK